MGLLFGYMDILIYIKWNNNYSNDTSNAPSIFQNMINLLIKLGSVEDRPIWGKYKKNKKGKKIYTQEIFHKIILIVCLVSLILMVIPKSIILYIKQKRNEERQLNLLLNDRYQKEIQKNKEKKELLIKEENIFDKQHKHTSYLKEKEETFFSMTDLVIEQLINTIEFLIGIVGNTASYLRLWALSLAHSQLSRIFFERIIFNFLNKKDFYYGINIISMVIGYFIFANITIFILIFMDSMECFLHTLRLHWVEFQNKFYYADGVKFIPFRFKNIIERETTNKVIEDDLKRI